MPHITLTDAQIDSRATAYARQHRVSYSEALSKVVAFAEAQTSTGSAAAIRTTPQPQSMTDADADAAASRYAAQNGVDYMTALRIVMQGQNRVQTGNGASHASESDRRIDAAATSHVRATGVSYSDALTHVTSFAASFSESAPGASHSGVPGNMQSDAVQAMQQSSAHAGQSVEQAQRAASALDGISQRVNQISEMSLQIAAAVEQQSLVSEDINRNIISIRQASEESVVAGQHGHANASDVAGLAEDLRRLAEEFWQRR